MKRAERSDVRSDDKWRFNPGYRIACDPGLATIRISRTFSFIRRKFRALIPSDETGSRFRILARISFTILEQDRVRLG